MGSITIKELRDRRRNDMTEVEQYEFDEALPSALLATQVGGQASEAREAADISRRENAEGVEALRISRPVASSRAG